METMVYYYTYVVITSLVVTVLSAMDYNEYASYYPTLFGRDPRAAFYRPGNGDHRHFFCDCNTFNKNQYSDEYRSDSIPTDASLAHLKGDFGANKTTKDDANFAVIDSDEQEFMSSNREVEEQKTSERTSSLTDNQPRPLFLIMTLCALILIIVVLIIVAVLVVVGRRYRQLLVLQQRIPTSTSRSIIVNTRSVLQHNYQDLDRERTQRKTSSPFVEMINMERIMLHGCGSGYGSVEGRYPGTRDDPPGCYGSSDYDHVMSDCSHVTSDCGHVMATFDHLTPVRSSGHSSGWRTSSSATSLASRCSTVLSLQPSAEASLCSKVTLRAKTAVTKEMSTNS